jgi:hypothetical protein
MTPHKVLSDIEKVSQETGIATSTLNRIIWCESRGDQSARNINLNNTIDIGLFQVNSIHIPEAQSMGLDLTTRTGNLSFAVTLIKKDGLRDWSASKSCWSYPQ